MAQHHQPRTEVPAGTRNTAAAEKSAAERPLAAVATTDVDDVVLVCEDSGISPRSVAAGLERAFPGVSVAARRLLTRVDVE